MSKLRNVSLKFGSESEPMVLTDYHIKGLSSVASDKDVTTKKFSGWIEPKSGYISRGDKYALELLNDGNGNYVHIKCDNVTKDEYYMTCANNQTGLLEGAVTSIEAHGIAQSALEIEMESVIIISNPGEVDEKILKGKFSYNKSSNTFTVNPPSDNYGWKAEVTFKACPFYLSDFEKTIDSNYTRARILVTATSIDGITILGVDRLSEGTKGTFTYALTPSVSTKVVNNVSWSNANTMNKIGTATGEYFAAEGERSDTITLTVEIKGMTNKLTASKNIIIDGAILNDTDKNPVVFAAVKTALGLGDDVHYFSTNDAEYISDVQIRLITDQLKNITSDFTFNEFQYFTAISIIPDALFENVKNITSVEWPPTITEFKKQCFKGCTKLNIDHLPPYLEIVNNYDINGSGILDNSCPSVFKYIPDTLRAIPISGVNLNPLFTNAQRTSSTQYELSNDNVVVYVPNTSEYTIKDGVKQVGAGAFCECISMRELTVPDSVETFSFYSDAIYNTSIKKLIINGVKNIYNFYYGSRAFPTTCKYVEALKCQTFDNTSYAFTNLVFKLTDVVIRKINPNTKHFDNCILIFDGDLFVVVCNTTPSAVTSAFVVDDTLYDEYIESSNWSLIPDRIVKRSVYDAKAEANLPNYLTVTQLLS